MNSHPTARKIRINRAPVSDEFLPQESDRDGRLGFGWADSFKPYRAFQRGAFGLQGTNNGPFDSRSRQGTTNNGPFDGDDGGSGTNNGPFGSYSRVIGLGYQPDLPDMRDYAIGPKGKPLQHSLKFAIEDIIKSIQESNLKHDVATKGGRKNKAISESAANALPSFLLGQIKSLPSHYDLRATGHFSPVEDQGQLGSCTAQAVSGLIEYLMRAGGNDGQEMSRLFLYKLSRRLLGWDGDTGAYLRTTIKSAALFGIPPENEWPYDVDRYNEEPLAYHFAYAQNFRATTYARLDGYGDGEATLDSVKRCLLDGFPVVFGFPVYSSIDEVGVGGRFVIPVPRTIDTLRGGHAVLAVGYNDGIDTAAPSSTNGRGRQGALIIRNSWGSDWGATGYAYLPYEYVRQQLAIDFWTIFNKDWLNLARFD